MILEKTKEIVKVNIQERFDQEKESLNSIQYMTQAVVQLQQKMRIVKEKIREVEERVDGEEKKITEKILEIKNEYIQR